MIYWQKFLLLILQQSIDPYVVKKDIKKKLIAQSAPKWTIKKKMTSAWCEQYDLARNLVLRLEEETLQAMRNELHSCWDCGKERITETDLWNFLPGLSIMKALCFLKNTGLLQPDFTELIEGIGMSQNTTAAIIRTMFFTHNVLSLKYLLRQKSSCPFCNSYSWCCKPRVASTDKDGLVIFYNTMRLLSRRHNEICDRLRFSKNNEKK